MAVLEGKIYAGCHCNDWDFQGTNVYSTPGIYQKVDPISFVGRYDFNTLEHEASWNPAGLDSNSGEGPWALEADQDKCLWFAGDFNASGYSGDAAQDYLGNFGRFCPEDQMAPSTPTTLQVSFTGATANLSWQSATDDSGSVEYWVYRDGRVIGSTFGRTFSDPDRAGASTYAVRAVDARGNKSASEAPVTAAPPPPVQSDFIAAGSAWRYQDSGSLPGANWAGLGFDDSAWAEGPAQLGWGDGDEATVVGPAKPVTSYYRQSFEVVSENNVGNPLLSMVIDDGAIVYLNGTEWLGTTCRQDRSLPPPWPRPRSPATRRRPSPSWRCPSRCCAQVRTLWPWNCIRPVPVTATQRSRRRWSGSVTAGTQTSPRPRRRLRRAGPAPWASPGRPRRTTSE